jgi:hypothetical protein
MVDDGGMSISVVCITVYRRGIVSPLKLWEKMSHTKKATICTNHIADIKPVGHNQSNLFHGRSVSAVFVVHHGGAWAVP